MKQQRDRSDDGEVFEGSFDVLRDSSWLCSADIPWDKDTVVQIQNVRRHKNLKLRDETKETAGTLHFVGKKKCLLLNAGHRAVLKALFGDAKGVQGQWVSLYVDPDVPSFGQIVSAVRIRARRPAMPGAARGTPVKAPLVSFDDPADEGTHARGWPDDPPGEKGVEGKHHDSLAPLSEAEMAANDAKTSQTEAL